MNVINTGRYIVALSAAGIAVNACLYFMQDAQSFSFVVQRDTYAAIYPLLYLHISGGVLALVTGAIQFFPASRAVITNHRRLGYVYLGAVVVGGIAGYPVAAYAFGGASNTVAFGLLASLWLFTTLTAFARIRRGNVVAHRQWMLRSYALTFAAVTLRAELGILIGVFGLSLEQAYLIVPWTSWVLNLIVVEWCLIDRLPIHRSDESMVHSDSVNLTAKRMQDLN